MSDAEDSRNPPPRSRPMTPAGIYSLGRTAPAPSELDEVAEHIGSFIVSIWSSVLELPISLGESSGRTSEALSLRVTVAIPGLRWVRVACGPELGRVIGAHVFGQPLAEVDFASSRMAVLELASAVAKHAAVIEHPAWPWTTGGERPALAEDRTTACELWFDCCGRPLTVGLLCRPDPRSGG